MLTIEKSSEKSGNLLKMELGSNLDSPLFFSLSDRGKTISWHGKIADTEKIDRPYFEFTERGEELLFTEDYGNGLKLKVGTLGAFSTDEAAAILHDQIKSYVIEKAMGDFPEHDDEAVQKLTASMISGRSASDILVAIIKYADNGYLKPVTGAMVTHGSGSRSLRQCNGNPDSSIATFAAVKVEDETLIPDIKESEAVCLTRFFRQEKSVMQSLNLWGAEYRYLPFEVVAYLVKGYVGFANKNESEIPKYAIIDTHKPDVMKFMKEHFGAFIVADNGKVQSTDFIKAGILKYHYGYYEGQIGVAALETNSFLAHANAFIE